MESSCYPEILFKRIIGSERAFFKHQKMDEDDLTENEKRTILEELFNTHKNVFVQRYARYIQSEDLTHFDDVKEDECVSYLFHSIEMPAKVSQFQIRNRRFMAVQKLKEKGDYFSDEKMREREPYLYDAMVGKFLEESERAHLRPSVNREGGWAAMLEQFEESSEVAQRRNVQAALYEHTSNTSAKEDREERILAHVANAIDKTEDEEMDEDGLEELREEIEKISEEDAAFMSEGGNPEQLRGEFDAYMVERFLAGKDSKFFNYEEVDKDEQLDVNDIIRDRDEEERWFDED